MPNKIINGFVFMDWKKEFVTLTFVIIITSISVEENVLKNFLIFFKSNFDYLLLLWAFVEAIRF